MIRIATAVALMCCASVAFAQAGPQPSATPPAAGQAPQPCELHVWPAEDLDGLSQTAGAIFSRASEEEIEGSMTDLLYPSAQLAALRDPSVLGELGLPT